MIRRLMLVAALVGVTGCSLKDAFSGHQDVVASAAGQDLTVERVAAMLAPAKPVPLNRNVVDRIANLWVDYQLLAQALAAGDSLTDSATIAAANWPMIAQALANQLHDSLVQRVKPTPAQVDSAYAGPDFRYLSHILVRVSADTTDAVKAAKRRQIEGYLAQLRGGTDFATLASRVSEDGSRQAGGSLGMQGRGELVKPFEDAAWALEPGQLSGIVETAYGYHIIWRPALAMVRDSFAVAVENVFTMQFDSTFLDSLTNKTGISVRKSAPAIARSAAQDLGNAKARARTLATFRGGRLSERDFARWLQAFPPQTRGQVAGAPDSVLTEFVKSLCRNEQLIRAAERRGLRLSAADWDTVRARYRVELAQVLGAVGLSRDSLAADSAGARSARAAQLVDAYFQAITNTPGARPYYEVPPFLADQLRERGEWRLYQAGLDRALERARVLRGPETPPAQSPMGSPNMTPAPIQPGGQPPLPQRGN